MQEQKAQHPVSDFTESTLRNLRTFVDANTVVGDPIAAPGGAVIIPISKVSFGYGGGGTDIPGQHPELFGAGSGGGVTIQPLAFLIVRGEKVELLQLQTADNTADRIVNAVPSVIDKILDLIPKKNKEKPVDPDLDPPADPYL